MMPPPPPSTANIHHNGAGAGGVPFMRHHAPVDPDFPLRILVSSDMVGAIIGRAGSTIKHIIQHSKARIDVHREDTIDPQEKVIAINGAPKCCSTACFKIIEIIENEKLQTTNKINTDGQNNNLYHNNNNNPTNVSINSIDPSTEIQLRMLAFNNLVGRLIGKSGSFIKKIMEQTSTKINISADRFAEYTSDRIITVVGSFDQVRHAEQIISNKLRGAYMADINALAMNQGSYNMINNVPMHYMPGPYSQNTILNSLVHPGSSHSGHAVPRSMPLGSHQGPMSSHPIYSNSTNYLPLYLNMSVTNPGLLGFNSNLAGTDMEKETVNIFIPNNMVGAIIGKSGSAIKEMISKSGASIKVAAAPTQSEQQLHAIPPKEHELSTDRIDPNVSHGEQSPANGRCHESEQNQITDSGIGPDEQDGKSAHDDKECESTSEQNPPNNMADYCNQAKQNIDPHHQPSFGRQTSSENHLITRRVTIVGNPESQRSAQYFIYRKISLENSKSDISLMVEIQIPSTLVGKIIGKGGSTVKHIQKQTRTIIRLSDEKLNESETDGQGTSETSVQITGLFQNSQLAQKHIRQMVRDSLNSTNRQNKHYQSNKNESNSISAA